MHIKSIVAGVAILIVGLSTPSYAGGKADCVSNCGSNLGKASDEPTRATTKPTRATTKKINYTIRNDSRETVIYHLPTGKHYKHPPRKTARYTNTWKGYRKPQIHVHNSGRTYPLKSGDYKFCWMKKAGRIGFDRAYKTC